VDLHGPPVALTGFVEPLPEKAHRAGDAPQLLEMLCGEALESTASVRAQAHPHHPGVVGIGITHDQSGRLRTTDEPDRAVLSQEQMVGDLAHRGSAGIAMAAHGQEQLVLRSGEPSLGGALLTPVQEAPEAVAESE